MIDELQHSTVDGYQPHTLVIFPAEVCIAGIEDSRWQNLHLDSLACDVRATINANDPQIPSNQRNGIHLCHHQRLDNSRGTDFQHLTFHLPYLTCFKR